MGTGYIIITNNPMVDEKFSNTHDVVYKEVSYREILEEAMNWIMQGHELLTHPLSGSVKPNETPYKSLLVRKQTGKPDARSIELIERAVETCDKFEKRTFTYKPGVYKDFQLVDMTLIESGMSSADEWL
ncbi:MAG: GrdX family protein [Eubacterium sp.]|jgi:hypothetical protein|uniref:GrdX family protein n=1 Tax=Eubacterium sp. F2 TaxID=3381348 RepID=UPI003907FFBE|nr:GrdX family protein [Eubacterium sp.]MCI2197775.1 GrdX family protein [Eubacterium sp.]